MDLPAGLAAWLVQRLQKTPPIQIVTKDWLTPVAAIHHMVNGTGVFDTQFTRHAVRPSGASSCVNLKD
jgi:hypothetical protein